MQSRDIRKYCRIDSEGRELLKNAERELLNDVREGIVNGWEEGIVKDDTDLIDTTDRSYSTPTTFLTFINLPADSLLLLQKRHNSWQARCLDKGNEINY